MKFQFPFPGWARMVALLALLISTAQFQGQDAQVEVTVNSTAVRAGDALRVTVSFVNCKVKEIDPPVIPGLEWRMGPSTSNSTQWINGVTTSEQRFTYGYVVKDIEAVNIPSLVWNTNRGKLKSNAIRVEVLGKNDASGRKERGPSKSQVNRDLVTAIETNKRTIYLGEPVILTYKIYNRYNNLDVRNYDIPELEGFWKENIPGPDARWEPQLINGKRYNVATVKKIVAFPQQSGSFELKDFTLNGYLRINFFEGREIQATCDPVIVEVLPLPEAAPANSLGTFSNLAVDQKLSKDSIGTNEAVNVEIVFRGNGNLKFLREPAIAWPSEFEVFDAEIEDNIAISSKGEMGERSFKFVVIPRAPGTYTLPEFVVQAFDPLLGKHVERRAPPLRLVVGKNANPLTSQGVAFSHQQSVQILNRDVRHILKDEGCFYPRGEFPWSTGMLGLAFGIGPLAFGIGWRKRAISRAQAKVVRGTRKKRALQVLLRALKSNQQKGLSIEQVGEAMEQYLMSKTGLDRSQLNREAVHNLTRQHLPKWANDWDELWASLELQRYGATQGDLDEWTTRLIELAQKSDASWT